MLLLQGNKINAKLYILFPKISRVDKTRPSVPENSVYSIDTTQTQQKKMSFHSLLFQLNSISGNCSDPLLSLGELS